MQFLIMALDGTDAGAPERRLAAREAHLAGVREMRAARKFIEGGAILHDAGKMVGSALIMEFADRAELDAWLAADPYTTGEVWKSVELRAFRCAPR